MAAPVRDRSEMPEAAPEAGRDDWSDWGEESATFGDRLAHAREAMGLSQGQLAHRMGVKLQSLRNWEENRAEPRANRLQMLAGMLNVSMVWLLSGRGEAPGADDLAGAGSGVEGCLAELRAIRTEHIRLTERLGRLEKRLRAAAV